MIELIDTHCHLDFPALRPDADGLLDAAQQVGVGHVVVPGVCAANWSSLLTLCAGDQRLSAALGMHPCFMAQHRAEHVSALEALLATEPVVAVGEIGLDLFIEQADFAAQMQLFQTQLSVAKAAQLPVLLHVRKAHDQVLAQLRRFKLPRGGIVHAFSGSQQQAQQYVELGFLLGFGGAISYSRATKLRKLVAQLPLEGIVLETDAPDMPLSHWRDEPNKPQRVADVAQLIAQLRDVAVAEVAAVTTQNARQLLRIA